MNSGHPSIGLTLKVVHGSQVSKPGLKTRFSLWE